MKGSKRKYLSEFAVNLCTSRWLLTSASQLTSDGTMNSENQDISDNCHIYIISKMPGLSFSKDSFSYENGIISGHITYQIKGEKKELPFCLEFPLLDGATRLSLSEYPHREIQTFNNNGELVRYFPASALCIHSKMHLLANELNNLEVLYVGQSYGDGNRSAFDRLRSHSTLQKILAEIQYNSPDSEAYVLTFQYVPYRVITQMDGRSEVEESDEKDSERFYSILENPLTEHQQICLAEAGLIRYFQPKYNKIYKTSFPSQEHKILEECYHLDFSALVVEINTEELIFSLFSETIPASSHHIANIDLINHQDRWGFFHYASGDGTAEKFPDVITGS